MDQKRRQSFALLLVAGSAVCVVLLIVRSSPPRRMGILALIRGGDSRQAAERALKLVANTEVDSGPNAPEVAEALDLLVMARWQSGQADGPETLALAERSVTIKESALPGDDPRLARSLNNLAGLLIRAGRHEEAAAHLERVIEIRTRAYGDQDVRLAKPLNNLGKVHLDLGDLDRARREFERALDLLRHRYGEKHLRVAKSQNYLGRVLQAIGDLPEARRCLEDARKLHEQLLPQGHKDIAQSYQNLASVLQDMGAYTEAQDLLGEALESYEKNYGREHNKVANVLNFMGWGYARLGNRSAAKACYERSRRIRQRNLGPTHPHLAWTLNNQAAFHHEAGEHLEASRLYEQALELRRAAFGDKNRLVRKSYRDLATVLFDSGEMEAAFAQALRAEEIGVAHLLETVRSLAEREALRYGKTRTSGLDLALTILSAPGDGRRAHLEQVWDVVIRSRAVVLDEMAVRRSLLNRSNDPELQALTDGLQDLRRDLAGVSLRAWDAGQALRQRDELDEIRRAKETVERRLAEKSQAFRQVLEERHLGLEDVRTHLPSKNALLAFVKFDQRGRPRSASTLDDPEFDAGVRQPSNSLPIVTPAFAAFVINDEGKEAAFISLGDAETIETLVRRWREEVARGAVVAAPELASAEAKCRAAGEQLRTKIWDPVVPYLDAKRVFIVPDGLLHLVNFAALPCPESASYLIECEPEIHYLSTERDLIPASRPKPGGAGLLAVGGPDYGDFPEKSTDTRLRFTPLPATSREAAIVADLWRRGNSSSASVSLLEGVQASEKAFKEAAPKHQVIHLATHGFFLADRPGVMGLGTRGIDGLALAKGRGALAGIGVSPLALAGLALAGANSFAAKNPADEDGILTAEEIAGLDLTGVQWAVLSACDTGTGEVRAGEGILGLRRAFHIAGVNTIIMSLWPVDDEATLDWMAALYENRFVRHLPTSDAVRAASLTLLERRRASSQSTHPFRWASFIAAGDWR